MTRQPANFRKKWKAQASFLAFFSLEAILASASEADDDDSVDTAVAGAANAGDDDFAVEGPWWCSDAGGVVRGSALQEKVSPDASRKANLKAWWILGLFSG